MQDLDGFSFPVLPCRVSNDCVQLRSTAQSRNKDGSISSRLARFPIRLGNSPVHAFCLCNNIPVQQERSEMDPPADRLNVFKPTRLQILSGERNRCQGLPGCTILEREKEGLGWCRSETRKTALFQAGKGWLIIRQTRE